MACLTHSGGVAVAHNVQRPTAKVEVNNQVYAVKPMKEQEEKKETSKFSVMEDTGTSRKVMTRWGSFSGKINVDSALKRSDGDGSESESEKAAKAEVHDELSFVAPSRRAASDEESDGQADELRSKFDTFAKNDLGIVIGSRKAVNNTADFQWTGSEEDGMSDYDGDEMLSSHGSSYDEAQDVEESQSNTNALTEAQMRKSLVQFGGVVSSFRGSEARRARLERLAAIRRGQSQQNDAQRMRQLLEEENDRLAESRKATRSREKEVETLRLALNEVEVHHKVVSRAQASGEIPISVLTGVSKERRALQRRLDDAIVLCEAAKAEEEAVAKSEAAIGKDMAVAELAAARAAAEVQQLLEVEEAEGDIMRQMATEQRKAEEKLERSKRRRESQRIADVEAEAVEQSEKIASALKAAKQGSKLARERIRAKKDLTKDGKEKAIEQEAEMQKQYSRAQAIISLKKGVESAHASLRAKSHRRKRKIEEQKQREAIEAEKILKSGGNPLAVFRQRDQEKHLEEEKKKMSLLQKQRHLEIGSKLLEEERKLEAEIYERRRRRDAEIRREMIRKEEAENRTTEYLRTMTKDGVTLLDVSGKGVHNLLPSQLIDKSKIRKPGQSRRKQLEEESIRSELAMLDQFSARTEDDQYNSSTDSEEEMREKLLLQGAVSEKEREKLEVMERELEEEAMKRMKAEKGSPVKDKKDKKERKRPPRGAPRSQSPGGEVDTPSALNDNELEIYARPEYEGVWDDKEFAKVQEQIIQKQLRAAKKGKGRAAVDQPAHESTEFVPDSLLHGRQSKISFKDQKVLGRKFEGDAFLCKPDQIIFKDFEVGKTYTKRISLTNISFSFNSFKLLDLPANIRDFFSISYSVPGRMSAGLACPLKISFTPILNEDIETFLPVLSETGLTKVPLKCLTKKSEISIDPPECIDFGPVTLGEDTVRSLTFSNKGALSATYEIILPPGTIGARMIEPPVTDMTVEEEEESEEKTAEKKAVKISIQPVESETLFYTTFCFSSLTGEISGYGSTDIELVFTPDAVKEYDTEILIRVTRLDPKVRAPVSPSPSRPQSSLADVGSIRFSSDADEVMLLERSLHLIGKGMDVPVYLRSLAIDMRTCYVNRLYRTSLRLCNRGKTAFKFVIAVPKFLASSIQFLPKLGYVQAGGESEIQLKFRPTVELLKSLTKNLKNGENVPDSEYMGELGIINANIHIRVPNQILPVNFNFKAKITTLDLEFNPTSVDFNTCSIYESTAVPIVVTNRSCLPQQFGFVRLPSVISMNPFDGFGTLLPGETTTLKAVFSPSAAVEYSQVLTCKTMTNASFTIPFVGVGSQSPLIPSSTVVKMAATPLGSYTTSSVFLTNSSRKVRSFEIGLPTNSQLYVSPIVQSVGPGERVKIYIEHRPSVKNDLKEKLKSEGKLQAQKTESAENTKPDADAVPAKERGRSRGRSRPDKEKGDEGKKTRGKDRDAKQQLDKSHLEKSPRDKNEENANLTDLEPAKQRAEVSFVLPTEPAVQNVEKREVPQLLDGTGTGPIMDQKKALQAFERQLIEAGFKKSVSTTTKENEDIASPRSVMEDEKVEGDDGKWSHHASWRLPVFIQSISAAQRQVDPVTGLQITDVDGNDEDTTSQAIYLEVFTCTILPELIFVPRKDVEDVMLDEVLKSAVDGTAVLDFGAHPVRDAPAVLSAFVYNLSSEPITLNMKNNGVNPDGPFELHHALRPVPVNKQTSEVYFSFQPEFEGEYFEQVQLSSPRPNHHLDVRLKARGMRPTLRLLPDTGYLYCGDVLAGQKSQATFTVVNTSVFEVQYLCSVRSWGARNRGRGVEFDCVPAAARIGGGQSQQITVLFRPDHEGVFAASASIIASSKQRNDELVMELQGRAWSRSVYAVVGTTDSDKQSTECRCIEPVEPFIESPSVVWEGSMEHVEGDGGGSKSIHDIDLVLKPSGDSVVCSGTVDVGCVSGPAGEFVIDTLSPSATSDGISVAPMRGSVDSGHRKTITVTFDPRTAVTTSSSGGDGDVLAERGRGKDKAKDKSGGGAPAARVHPGRQGLVPGQWVEHTVSGTLKGGTLATNTVSRESTGTDTAGTKFSIRIRAFASEALGRQLPAKSKGQKQPQAADTKESAVISPSSATDGAKATPVKREGAKEESMKKGKPPKKPVKKGKR